MTSDDRFRLRLKAAAAECLSGVENMPSQRSTVLARLDEKRAPGKRVSFTLVFAIVMIMALAGAAAAGLGLFGRLLAQKENETSYERLALLEEAAQQTVQDGAVAVLHGETYDVTVDQAYCDGRKLYYSYTIKTSGEYLKTVEAMPEGLGEWDEAYPGMRFEDVLSTHMGEAADAQVANWLGSRDGAYVIVNHTYVGDGAELADGTYLTPVDSGTMQLDEQTQAAYYEVALPEGYAAGESIEFVLSILTTAKVFYQDETGVYAATRYQPDALVRMPVSVPVTGRLMRITGEGTADGYPASAEVFVSDVDVSGVVTIDAPENYSPESYVLMSGGAEYPNIDGYVTREGNTHKVHMRFDLPVSTQDMRLVPVDRSYIHETIELKGE